MTDLDTLVRSGLRDAADAVATPDTDALMDALGAARSARSRRGLREPSSGGGSGVRGPSRRRRPLGLLAAAALVVVAAVVATVVAWPNDDGQDVRAGAPSTSTSTTAPAAGFEVLGPGWHPLDTGPVEADASHQVLWTDGELVVVGGDGQTWRYRPADRTWSEATPAPLPPRSSGWYPGGAVWTGERAVFVFVDGAARWSATWDPTTDRWTPIGEVPVAPELTAAVGTTGVSVSNSTALLWSGERVFDLAHLASFDPEEGAWESLPLPEDLVRFTALLYSNPVFDGNEIVFTNVVGPGLAWEPDASAFRELAEAPARVSGDPPVVPSTVAAAIRGEVVLVSENADPQDPGPAPAVALDATSGRWRRLPDAPDVSGSLGCPMGGASVQGRVVIPRCVTSGTVVLEDGRWVDAGDEGRDGSCCLGRLVPAGGALVAWESDTDTHNNPEAPYVRAWIWVPR